MEKSVFTEKYGEFKRLLVEARRKAGLNQRQLAAKLNRPRSFVSRYELGERRIDMIEFLEIAKILDIDPIQFMKKLIGRKPSRQLV